MAELRVRRPPVQGSGGRRARRAAAGRERRHPQALGEHDAAVRRADRKTLLHPQVGRLTMDCETSSTAGAHPGGHRYP
ncbi:hypothetical protein [Nonomuraea rubra]|uniref:MmyB family transcriptional regulator n=1 Tax=Nonomuraea rubra TaxID=46180 RepID=UPI0033191B5E